MHCASKRLALVNLSGKGRKSRLILGLCGLAITLAAACWIFAAGVDPLWRWVLLVPIFGSLLCLLEAWCSTCVVLATLGAWDLGCGTQRVPDHGLESELRYRAWKLVGLSLVLSMVLTSLLCVCGHCH